MASRKYSNKYQNRLKTGGTFGQVVADYLDEGRETRKQLGRYDAELRSGKQFDSIQNPRQRRTALDALKTEITRRDKGRNR